MVEVDDKSPAHIIGRHKSRFEILADAARQLPVDIVASEHRVCIEVLSQPFVGFEPRQRIVEMDIREARFRMIEFVVGVHSELSRAELLSAFPDLSVDIVVVRYRSVNFIREIPRHTQTKHPDLTTVHVFHPVFRKFDIMQILSEGVFEDLQGTFSVDLDKVFLSAHVFRRYVHA